MDSSGGPTELRRPFSSALMSLTEELGSVRTAWQREGAELRQRISDLHAGRLDAEERAQSAENALVAQEQEWRTRVHDLQRQLRTAQADRDDATRRVGEGARQRHAEVSEGRPAVTWAIVGLYLLPLAATTCSFVARCLQLQTEEHVREREALVADIERLKVRMRMR